MKKTAYLLVGLVLLVGAPVFAQGPFTDVPTDHWAYDAVNQLQEDGILIGYPDGTFGGKRTITRYEFAVAIARVVGLIQPPAPGKEGLTKSEVEAMLGEYAKKSDLPSLPQNLATKADVDALRKLIDEFRDEIAALGVDVDALKRDVAALCARVEAIEAELKRVRWTGDANVFAIAGGTTGGRQTAVDLDQRLLPQGLARNISFVKDFDLNIVGRVTDTTTANATINYGNYLNYLGYVDDYIDGFRPTTKGGGGYSPNSLSDTFFPYYLYVESALGAGAVTVGRFPLQFTPYTLKKIDVDSYVNILKTEDGNYPMDGAKLAWNFGFVDLTLFAAKNDTNDFLINGLTGQPRAGIYSAPPATVANPGGSIGVLHQIANGNAVGGLTQVTQTAGVRGVFGLPMNGTAGLTYYQAWDRNGFNAGTFDQARVFGADLGFVFPFLGGMSFNGSWTQCDTLASDRAPSTLGDVDYLNTAWDGRFGFTLSNFGIGLGYKDIGRNFAAAGYWDKIGRWTNPTNIKGPYADLSIPIMDNLKIVANGEWLEVKDQFVPTASDLWGFDGDKLWKVEGGIKWAFSKNNALDLSAQWVKFEPDATSTATRADAKELYLTVGLAHQFSATTGLKVGYQFINYDDGNNSSGPYPADYRGGLGVVQFGVSF
jgi:hypothetical protein